MPNPTGLIPGKVIYISDYFKKKPRILQLKVGREVFTSASKALKKFETILYKEIEIYGYASFLGKSVPSIDQLYTDFAHLNNIEFELVKAGGDVLGTIEFGDRNTLAMKRSAFEEEIKKTRQEKTLSEQEEIFMPLILRKILEKETEEIGRVV